MTKKYGVYGDYGYESEQLLEDFDSRDEACDWASRYCRRDLGGYSRVEVLSFDPRDGEAVSHWVMETEDA